MIWNDKCLFLTLNKRIVAEMFGRHGYAVTNISNSEAVVNEATHEFHAKGEEKMRKKTNFRFKKVM